MCIFQFAPNDENVNLGAYSESDPENIASPNVFTVKCPFRILGITSGQKSTMRADLLRVITIMRKGQTRWAGHVSCMSDSRYLSSCCKVISVVVAGKQEASASATKHSLKAYLKDFNIDVAT